MKRFTLIVFLILWFCFVDFAQVQYTKEKIVDVNFCNLLKNPDEYKDKILRIKATYRSFFEVSEIYCSDCLQRRGTWVEFDNDLEDCTKKIFRKRLSKNSVLNLTVVGKFYTGSTYGHSNGYDSQLCR